MIGAHDIHRSWAWGARERALKLHRAGRCATRHRRDIASRVRARARARASRDGLRADIKVIA